MVFQSFETVDELLMLMFPHFIALISTSGIVHRYAINVMSIAVELSCHWKVEILYSDGTDMLDKTIGQSVLGFLIYSSLHLLEERQ